MRASIVRHSQTLFPVTRVCLEQVNNIGVLVRATTKNSIEEYGDPAKFLEDNQYLLGKQVFLGELRCLVVCVTLELLESCEGGRVHPGTTSLVILDQSAPHLHSGSSLVQHPHSWQVPVES